MQYIQEPFTLSCHPFVRRYEENLVVVVVAYQDVDAAAPWPINVKGRGFGRFRVKN